MEKNIKGFPLYTITDKGEVISYKTGKPVKRKLVKDKDGYFRVSLSNNNHSFTKKIHRLVAEAFIPNPQNLPQVNHINGIKTDNRVENLEWISISGNIKHSWDIGLRESHRNVLSNLGKVTIKKATDASKKPIEMVELSTGNVLDVFDSSYTASRLLFPDRKHKYVADIARTHRLNSNWGIVVVNGKRVFFRLR